MKQFIPIELNFIGVLTVAARFCFKMVGTTYQSVFLKMCNKNFKNYPLKNMFHNKEMDNRWKNALYLNDKDTVFELYFCLQCCDNQTINDVLKWCNGSSERLQYRHLEELRGRVLSQFKNYSIYTKRFSQWKERSFDDTIKTWVKYATVFFDKKIMKELHKQMNDFWAVYALRNQLEATANSAEAAPMRHSLRKLQKI